MASNSSWKASRMGESLLAHVGSLREIDEQSLNKI
jgi:hypothetical protein